MIEADPELIHLDMGYDPHRSEISRWLMTLPDQTLVDNNIIGKAGVMRTKYEPPAKMNVIMLLEQAGFLKNI
ncbi:MAG: hypothetical protein HWD59_10585 [Coxiellaceae bacterium]|nr:MAG: hypothetical protein HWD59_10585 [Coxiellaceae bacterium]